jgi:hypothetical protein
MSMHMTSTTWVILAMFVVGLLFTMTHTSKSVREAFEGNPDSDSGSGSGSGSNSNKNRCPNILIQKGAELYLHNSRLSNVPGVNPLKFNNLEEYVEFTDWQRGQGIRCPILYLQHSFDAQGKPVYKIRPSPLNLQGGLPPVASAGISASNANANFIDDADKPPMNAGSYPAFDPMEPNVGSAKGQPKKLKGLSANPMDPNWGGDSYTQSLIDAGKYAGDEVSIMIT